MKVSRWVISAALSAAVFDFTFGMHVNRSIIDDENFPSEIAEYTINPGTNIDEYHPSLLKFYREDGLRSIRFIDIIIGGDFVLLTDVGLADVYVSGAVNIQEVAMSRISLNGKPVCYTSNLAIGIKKMLIEFLLCNLIFNPYPTFPVGEIHFSLWDSCIPQRLFLQQWPTGYRPVDDIIYRGDLHLQVLLEDNKIEKASREHIKNYRNFVFCYGNRKNKIYISLPPERNVWKFHQSRMFLNGMRGQEINPESVLGRAIRHVILTTIALPKMAPALLESIQNPVYEGNVTLSEDVLEQIWLGIHNRLFPGKWVRISAVGDEERRNVTMNDLRQGGDFVFRIDSGIEVVTFLPLYSQNIDDLEMIWNGKKLNPRSIWVTKIKKTLLSYGIQ